MAKIIFNNKNYSIDNDAFTSAANSLKQHLLTTMSGSGKVINLDGTPYNVDSTKLQAATNDFVTHLGTLSGSGAKIKVGNVEFAVDSTKLDSVITDLGTAFDELEQWVPGAPMLAPGLYQSGAIALYRNGNYDEASAMMISSWSDLEADGTVAISEGEPEIVLPEQPSTPPTLNEYGFYYGVEYSMGTSIVATFNADGSAIAIIEGERIEIPAGAIVYSDHFIDLTAINYGTAVVSEDGTQLEFVDLDGMVLTANINTHECGVYFGVPYYAILDGQAVVLTFNANGSITMFDGLGRESMEIPAESVVYGDHIIDTSAIGGFTLEVSQDGTQLMMQNTDITFNIGWGRPPKGTVYLPKISIDVPKSIIEGDLVLPCDGSATGLNNHAFYRQNLLTSILLPDGITTIGDSAFSGCSSLTNITSGGTISQWNAISKGNVWDSSTGNYIVYCKDGNICKVHKYESIVLIEPTSTENGLVKYICSICGETYTAELVPTDFLVDSYDREIVGYTGEESENLVIPATFENNGTWYRVVKICQAAFRDCINLTSVTIPDSVTTIGGSAFYDCTNLTNITFNGTVSQWNTVVKESDKKADGVPVVTWNYNVPATYVQCSDGQVAL